MKPSWGTATGALVMALAGVAGPAQAATGSTIRVYQDGPVVVEYRAGSGQVNSPTLTSETINPDTRPEAIYTVHDVAPITPGDNCTRPDPADPNTAECRVYGDPQDGTDLEFYLGDQADHADLPGVRVHGGPGDDVLSSGHGGVLFGEAGDDVLLHAARASGGPGDDRIVDADYAYGDDGDDHLAGGAGQDFLSGGPGRDTVTQ